MMILESFGRWWKMSKREFLFLFFGLFVGITLVLSSLNFVEFNENNVKRSILDKGSSLCSPLIDNNGRAVSYNVRVRSDNKAFFCEYYEDLSYERFVKNSNGDWEQEYYEIYVDEVITEEKELIKWVCLLILLFWVWRGKVVLRRKIFCQVWFLCWLL